MVKIAAKRFYVVILALQMTETVILVFYYLSVASPIPQVGET